MSRVSKYVVLGGIGGGGDGGGALPFAYELEKRGVGVVFASFVNAFVSEIKQARVITGSLVRVYPYSYSPSFRFFEPSVAMLGYETYVVCTKESKDKVVKAMEWVIDTYGPKALIYVDMGGDALVFGDEPLVGSWKEDMAGLSILSEVSRKKNVRAFLGVGVLGGEAGGKGLSLPHLAENIEKLVRMKAYYGYYEPRDNVKKKLLNTLPRLLKKTPSAMLTLYFDSLRGVTGVKEYHVLYLQGTYPVKPYYRYHFFFDPVAVCKKSIFCQYMRKHWRRGARTDRIRKYIRRTPRMNLEKTVKKMLEKEFAIDKIIL